MMSLLFCTNMGPKTPTLPPSHKVASHGVFLDMRTLYNVDIMVCPSLQLSLCVENTQIPLVQHF